MPEEEKTEKRRLNKATVKKILIGTGVTLAVVGVTILLTRKIDDGTVTELASNVDLVNE